MNKRARDKIAEYEGRVLEVTILDSNFVYSIMATKNGAVKVDPERVKPTGKAVMYFSTFQALFEGKMNPRDALLYHYVIFNSETPIADYILITTFLESIGISGGNQQTTTMG